MPQQESKASDTSKVEVLRDLEFSIPVGTKVSINRDSGRERLWSFLVGMEYKKYILIRMPAHEINQKPLVNEQITVRYLKGSLACGFNTTITGIIDKPYPLIFLEYPPSVEVLNLRNSERVFCFVDVVVFWEGHEGAGKITDISKSGCKIAMESAKAGVLLQIGLNDEIFCRFKLEENEEDKYVKGYVRHCECVADKVTLGVEFEDMPDPLTTEITSYIKTVKEYIEINETP